MKEEFKGSTQHLIDCINVLLSLDEMFAIGLNDEARPLMRAAADRLRASIAALGPELVVVGAMHRCRKDARFSQCVHCGAMAENLAKPCKHFVSEARVALAAASTAHEQESVISSEDSLRAMLRWEREKTDALEHENRLLRGLARGHMDAVMKAGGAA